MRRALLTGATGGLGMAAAPLLLAEGYAVRTTGRDPVAGEALRAMGASFVAAELTDSAAARSLCKDIDVVFHAAALSSPWGPREQFEAVNVTATRALLAAARAAGCDAFVFVSSPSIYSEPRDRLGLTEESPLARRFTNAYAATKHAGERLVLEADASGFSTIALRPRAIVGAHDRVLLPRLLRVARSGRFPLFRQGRAFLDLTDARDAARAMLCADQARLRASGQVFNLSAGRPLPAKTLLELAFKAAGVSPRLIEVPYPLAAATCALAEAVCAALPGRPEPPATRYSLSTLAFSQTFDLARAARVLDWRPRITPEQAIAEAGMGMRHAAM